MPASAPWWAGLAAVVVTTIVGLVKSYFELQFKLRTERAENRKNSAALRVGSRVIAQKTNSIPPPVSLDDDEEENTISRRVVDSQHREYICAHDRDLAESNRRYAAGESTPPGGWGGGKK